MKSLLQRLRFLLTPSLKTRLSVLQRLNKCQRYARILGEGVRLKGYCYKRLDPETVKVFGEFAKQEDINLKYIQEVLTYEFLNNNIWMNERERKLVKEAASLVVNYMKRCK